MKQTIRRFAPTLVAMLGEQWTKKRKKSIERSLGLQCGWQVRRGPFRGLLLRSSSSGNLTTKLLGCYELELHHALERLCRNSYDVVLNIGCAEGYYAVGLARRLPSARVLAFDLDPLARTLCQQTAEANGVSGRLEIVCECTIAILRSLAAPRTLIVSDCEGGELTLLDPASVPGLRSVDILVELHHFVDANSTRIFEDRFASTHQVDILSARGRDPDEYQELAPFGARDRRIAVAEFRPPDMQWAVMTAKRTA